MILASAKCFLCFCIYRVSPNNLIIILTSYSNLFYNPYLTSHISFQVSIAARQPIGPCLLGPSSSLLGKGSGRVGRHPTANSLPGSPLIIVAGPPIDWPSVGYLISPLAPSVIRMWNLFIISLRRVCSPGRSGLGAPESEPYSSNSTRRFEQV